jgi:uncharacterized protein YjdB
MAYTKQTFIDGQTILNASHFNHIEDGIVAAEIVATEASNLAKSKQEKLVSGTNIKTVNGESILGIGNILIKNSCKNVVINSPVSTDSYAGKKIAFIGDSITQGVGASSNAERYTTVLANLLGMTEVNLGQSGTVLCTGGHRTCNIGKLSVGNLTGCDVVTIMMGINDWDQAKSDYYKLGEFGSTDTTTIYGAVDYWCKKIIEIKNTSGFENTKFFFITPIITSWNNSVGGNNWDQNKTNIHGFTLRELCQAIINVCDVYEIPVLDMNKYSGIYYNSADDNTVGTYFGDGIHPNSAGHAQIAQALNDYLLQNPTYVKSDEALKFILQTLLSESTKISYPNFDNVETLVINLTGITLSPSSISLFEGETTSITAKLTPTNTTQTSLRWESSDVSIATVDNGKIIALAEGTVTITCKSVDNGNILATANVVVSKAESLEVTGLLISESTKTVTQGQKTTLTVSYVPSATTQKGVTWSSDNTSVATVVGNGDSCTVTAVGGGQCNIIATSTHNPSIKTQCFFTTTEQSEGGDNGDGDGEEPDTSNYVLGSNVTYDASANTLKGKVNTDAYGKVDNVAIYKVPLKAGMEVEIVSNFSSTPMTYAAIGVDTTTNIADLRKLGSYQVGLFNVYHDNPSKWKEVITLNPTESGVANARITMCNTGNNTSPRTTIIKRAADGTLSGSCNGNEFTMPSYSTLATANESENLYVFIAGISADITWKINYFGELR